MKVIIIRTVPGEICLSNITYNEQYIGLARALTRAGHQCDIICGETNGKRIESVYVTNDKCIKIFFVESTVVLKNCILHFDHSFLSNYDIIQPIEYNQIYTWKLAKEFKGKCIVYHGPYYCSFNKRFNLMAKVFDELFLNRYLKLNTPFITKSGYATEYLRSKGITSVESIGVGIDPDSFTNPGNLSDVFCEEIKRLNVNVKLLYIGRIEPRRNSLFLIKVLKRVRDEGINAGLVIVGNGKTEYVEELNKRIIECKLENYILFKSSIEQKYLPEVYHMVDVFVLPTHYDIYGMVILEAMFFGTPIVTTPCGGAQMMIESGVNGFVIDGFDEELWSATIAKIVNDNKLRNMVIDAARACVRENYTWDALVPKFLDAYKRACLFQ